MSSTTAEGFRFGAPLLYFSLVQPDIRLLACDAPVTLGTQTRLDTYFSEIGRYVENSWKIQPKYIDTTNTPTKTKVNKN